MTESMLLPIDGEVMEQSPLRDYGSSEDLAAFVGREEFFILTTPERVGNIGRRLSERFGQFVALQFSKGGSFEGKAPSLAEAEGLLHIDTAANSDPNLAREIADRSATLALLRRHTQSWKP